MAQNQRGSVLCPNCRKLVSTDEIQCPYCGISRPGSWWKNNTWSMGFYRSDQIVKSLIYLNIGMYIVSLLFTSKFSSLSINPFFVLSPENDSLLLLGATGTIPIDRLHRWWTLISANYLHGSILHILFNMLAFKQLAPLVIREYGSHRMLIIYSFSGTIGFGVSYLAGVSFTIGASAAICGLMGALLYYGKSRGGIYGQTIYKQVATWAAGIFLFGLMVPGIDNWGHGGGLIAGVFTAFVVGYEEKKQLGFLHKAAALTCVILTLLILIWATLSGVYYRVLG